MEFLQRFLDHYDRAIDVGEETPQAASKSLATQLAVIRILQRWRVAHEAFSPDVKAAIANFELATSGDATPPALAGILARQPRRLPLLLAPAERSFTLMSSTAAINLADVAPSILAEQLFFLDYASFRLLQPSELQLFFLGLDAPRVQRVLHHPFDVQDWVLASILFERDPVRRVAVITRSVPSLIWAFQTIIADLVPHAQYVEGLQ